MIHTKIINDELIQKYFRSIQSTLLKKNNRFKVLLTRQWARDFSKQAGVYGLFIKDNLRYVGETGNLSKRMGDLLNTKNHCSRRSLGDELFAQMKGYQKADSRNSFPSHIEIELDSWIKKNVEVSPWLLI